MTKITYMSDLHLEFDANVDPGSGDILLLAGDILVAKYLDPVYQDANARSLRKRYMKFYEKTLESYKQVYYIHGNHEPYGCDINYAWELTQKFLPQWKEPYCEYPTDKTTLVGCTLWTDMNKRDAFSMTRVGMGMNDFSLIWKDNKKFRPSDAADRFDEGLVLITDVCKLNLDRDILVVTHHAPSKKGISLDHHGSNLNAGYYSDLEEFIKENSNIKYWIHGHTHIQKEYMIGQCKVLSNARGYKYYEDCADTFEPRSLGL